MAAVLNAVKNEKNKVVKLIFHEIKSETFVPFSVT